MKAKEFENIKNQLVNGRIVKFRFFTYHKTHWVDIVGEIHNIYGTSVAWDRNSYYFTIKFMGIVDEHFSFDKEKRPSLNLFSFNGIDYMNVHSSKILFVKDGSIRAEKLKLLKERMEDI